MKKGIVAVLCSLAVLCFTTNSVFGEECVSPAFEYYMEIPMESTCETVSLGVEFINPFDELPWNINTTDSEGNILNAISPGEDFYLTIVGTGEWGLGYMPHIYVPGDYSGTTLTWEQSWVGAYTGSAYGFIEDIDSIEDRNPITVSEPNLVIKTPVFASGNGNNTLIVAQEQVFVGWWGGPWTEPDAEIITWTIGPFIADKSVDFTMRTLLSPVLNDEIYVADNTFTVTIFKDDKVECSRHRKRHKKQHKPRKKDKYKHHRNGDID